MYQFICYFIDGFHLCRRKGEDYKSGSQFQTHIEEKSQASSHFARSRTFKQQREYLPIFAVRHELMQIIKDNQVCYFCCRQGLILRHYINYIKIHIL